MRKLLKQTFIVPYLVMAWCAVPAATAQSASPRLVVEIVVGQMRYDYLTRFSHNFSQSGFNRFINEGINCTDARYNYSNTTSPAGLATISTGANPSMHGIVSQGWMDYTTNEHINVIEDSEYAAPDSRGMGSHYAPTRLTAGTVGDELKRHNRASKVISVALEPVSAIIPGGRAADAAYWLDVYGGKWTTGKYYMNNLPGWVERYNTAGYMEAFKERTWDGLLLPSQYIYNKAGSSMGSRARDYREAAKTPTGTEMVMDFARSAIIYENLGKSDNTDLLIITIDPTRYVAEAYGTESMEIEDTYYRLDEQLGNLVLFLDGHLGMGNVMVVVTSDHGSNDTRREDGKAGGGVFNVMQFRVLMNGFLNSQYGTDNWVVDYGNRSLYLNRRTIFEKGLNLAEMQANAAAFAMQFRGVAQAVTANALQNNHFAGGTLEKVQNGYYAKHSGDIVLNLMPGWVEDAREGVVSTGGSMYEYDTHVPLMWFGGGIGSGTVREPVDMTDIAPTLARIMGTGRPNAVSGREIVYITSSLFKSY